MTFGVNFYAGGPATVDRLQVRANPCRMFDVQAQNTSGGDLTLMIFDSKLAPVAGATPLYAYLVADGLLFATSFPNTPPYYGRTFTKGVWVAWSTTSDTLTQAPASGTIYANGMDTV